VSRTKPNGFWQRFHAQATRKPTDRPSGPQSLATFPIRLRLATALRMRALQVESLKYDVLIFTVGGIYRVMGELHRVGDVASRLGGAASTNFLHRLGFLLLV
jgi:hypothetical protein